MPESFSSGLREISEIYRLVLASQYGERIRVDPSIVRGLEYYTGPVFEVDLTFQIRGDDGKPVRFGSVGAGGRYDGLVSRFRGEPVPATGFSIGVSRLAAALQHLGKLDSKPEPGPVVVTVFDKDRLADYQNMVAKLRAAKIRAELYLGNPRNLGNQLKYADKRNSPCVVIQGGDEKARGEVTIKDLIVGAELAKLEKGREEHLQKQGEAQQSVPEDEPRRRRARGAGAARAHGRAMSRAAKIIIIVVCALLVAIVAALAGMLAFGTSDPPRSARFAWRAVPQGRFQRFAPAGKTSGEPRHADRVPRLASEPCIRSRPRGHYDPRLLGAERKHSSARQSARAPPAFRFMRPTFAATAIPARAATSTMRASSTTTWPTSSLRCAPSTRTRSSF